MKVVHYDKVKVARKDFLLPLSWALPWLQWHHSWHQWHHSCCSDVPIMEIEWQRNTFDNCWRLLTFWTQWCICIANHHTQPATLLPPSLPTSLPPPFQDTPNQLERASCREGMYVKVVGHLRSFSKQRHIVAFNIRPIEDFNELSHHLAETVYCHLAVTKGVPVVREYVS